MPLTKTNKTEWLSGLKPGDEVAFTPGYSAQASRILTVERVTETTVIIDGAKYNRIDGHDTAKRQIYRGSRIGARDFISPVTPEIRDRIVRTALVERLSRFDYNRETTDELVRLGAILDEGNERRNAETRAVFAKISEATK